jgi:predicted lipid-binding transport protein (Tim44 family)
MIDLKGRTNMDGINVKGIPGLVAGIIGIILLRQGNAIFGIIVLLIAMVLIHFAKTDLRKNDATNKIRNVIKGMGYTSNDVERLTITTIGVLQGYAQRRLSNPKEYKSPESAMEGAYDVLDAMNSVAKAHIEWANFTQAELVSAIQTAATLLNVEPPQR